MEVCWGCPGRMTVGGDGCKFVKYCGSRRKFGLEFRQMIRLRGRQNLCIEPYTKCFQFS